MIDRGESQAKSMFIGSAIDDSDLDPYEFRIYAHLKRRAQYGEVWEKQELIALNTKMSRKKVNQVLTKLQEKGWIDQESRTYKGQQSTNMIFLLEPPCNPQSHGRVTDGYTAVSPTVTAKGTPLQGSPNQGSKKREEAPSAPLSELPEDELIESPEHQIEQGTEIDPQKDSGKANEGKPNVKALGKVPGGAAAGAETTEAYLRRKFSHSFVNTMLEELQPLGVDRKRDWFSIPIERAQELAEEARATHKQFKVQVQTRLKVLLDEEVQRKGLPDLPTTPAEDKFSKSAWEN